MFGATSSHGAAGHHHRNMVAPTEADRSNLIDAWSANDSPTISSGHGLSTSPKEAWAQPPAVQNRRISGEVPAFSSSSTPIGWSASFKKQRGMYSTEVQKVKTRRRSLLNSPPGLQAALPTSTEDQDSERAELLDSDLAPIQHSSRRQQDPVTASLFRSTMESFDNAAEDKVQDKSKSPNTWLLDPQKPAHLMWDLMIQLCVIYIAIVIPYEVTFLNYESTKAYFYSYSFWANRTVDTIYFVDVVLTFFTMYFDKSRQMWVSDKRSISRNYQRTWLIPDLLTLIPFDCLILLGDEDAGTFGRLIQFLRFIKLLRVRKSSQLTERLQESFPVNHGLLEVVKYLGLLFLITHWLACCFGALLLASPQINWAKIYLDDLASDRLDYVAPEDSPDPSDCNSENLYERDMSCYSPLTLYLSSLYWSAMTVTTIGYGDIVPTNRLEQTVVVLAMLLGGVVFGYIVGVFAGIISNQDQQQKRYREEMRDLNALIKEAGMPSEQAQGLRNFFKFLHVSRAMSMSAYQHLLSRMSPQLRGQVTLLTDNGWVERLPYFKNCPNVFVVELVQALGYQAFPPGETIFKYGDDNSQMYVVKKGVVFFGGRILLPGNSLCEESLYKPGLQGRSALTLTYTYLYTLSREAAHQVVRGYPDIERQFRVMSIKRLFREEVCSYAYAVQALFDEGLLAPIEESKAISTYELGADQSRHLSRLGFQGNFKQSSHSLHGEKLPYIHPLWGHLNVMRVDHYYKKLRMVIRVSQEEAERLDKSVSLIQKWIRGWIARKQAGQIKKQADHERQEELLAAVPAVVGQLTLKLDEFKETIFSSFVHEESTGRVQLASFSGASTSSPDLVARQASESKDIFESRIAGVQAQLDEQGRTLRAIMASLDSFKKSDELADTASQRVDSRSVSIGPEQVVTPTPHSGVSSPALQLPRPPIEDSEPPGAMPGGVSES